MHAWQSTPSPLTCSKLPRSLQSLHAAPPSFSVRPQTNKQGTRRQNRVRLQRGFPASASLFGKRDMGPRDPRQGVPLPLSPVPAPPVSMLGEGVSQVVAAFLRSQCSSCGKLDVRVGGEPGDLVQGMVPYARVVAENACYKGISLSQLSLTASRIKLQLPEIKIPSFLAQPASAATSPKKGKQASNSILKHNFTVEAEAHISPEHLNASLASPMVQDALHNVLPDPSWGPKFLRRSRTTQDWADMAVSTSEEGVFTLSGAQGKSQQLHLKVSLLPSGRHLRLQQLTNKGGRLSSVGDSTVLDMGEETQIQALKVSSGGVQLRGVFTVSP